MIGNANRTALRWALPLFLPLASSVHAQDAQRPWTAETSIETRYFAVDFQDPQHWPYPGGRMEGVLFSPDRRYFLFVTYRGDADDDAAVATITIYRSDAVRQALRSRARTVAPLRTLERRSRSSMRGAISSMRWDEGGGELLFEGLDEGGAPKLYRLGVESGRLDILDSLSENLTEISGYRDGTYVVIGSADPPRRPGSPGDWMNRREDGTPLFGRVAPGSAVVMRREARCAGRPAPEPDVASSYITRIAVSPTSCSAILVARTDAAGTEYRLLDVATGRSRSILLPGSCRCWVNWSPDGGWALLSMRTSARAGESPVSMFSPATGAIEPISGFAADAGRGHVQPRWISAHAAIVPDAGSPSGASYVELRDGRWSRRPGAELTPRPSDGFAVGLRQGLNEPARMVASSGRAEISLSDPDPALAGVARREWQEISFVAPNGRTARAALMLPAPAPAPGRSGPPPLVINPYWYENGGGSYNRLFMPDGQHDGAESAAQMLAARGFAVLWMDAWDGPEAHGTPAEGSAFVARVDAVLSELVRQRLIDPERIGMAGYSRGGFMTLFSATHPGRIPIRTHIAIDNYLGTTQSAFYLRTFGLTDRALELFADRPATLDRDTMLNVDRIRGPVMFTLSLGGERMPWSLQTLQGAFMAARRPFDQLSFPQGHHNLHRPSERLAMIGAITDWMSFWLMDQDPADPERARIWRQMRGQWRRQQAWEAAGNPVGSTPARDFQAEAASGGAGGG